jgi:hypothetical protein
MTSVMNLQEGRQMSEPVILIVPPQGLEPEDKRNLAAIGVVVIEMDDPQKARLIRASAEVASSDMLGAACEAIRVAGDSTIKIKFAALVCAIFETQAAAIRALAEGKAE